MVSKYFLPYYTPRFQDFWRCLPVRELPAANAVTIEMIDTPETGDRRRNRCDESNQAPSTQHCLLQSEIETGRRLATPIYIQIKQADRVSIPYSSTVDFNACVHTCHAAANSSVPAIIHIYWCTVAPVD